MLQYILPSADSLYPWRNTGKAAQACDTDGMISDALLGSAHGYVYDRAKQLRENPPAGFLLEVYDFDPDSRDD